MIQPSPTAPGSTASLRAANQRRVIDVLRRQRGSAVSQADIARAAQLAPATVSNIVRELVSGGMLETTAVGGRRGTEVRVSRAAGVVVGVDFGHRHVRVAVGDLAGEVVGVQREELAANHPHSEGLALAGRMVDQLLSEVGSTLEAVKHVGVGLPAPVSDAGLVEAAGILPGWIGVDARKAAEDQFGRPATVENDANLGALAEHRIGAGLGHHAMVFVKVSSGVGAGLILDDRLFRGTQGRAGELGHVTVDEQGPFCRCGSRGCLEGYTSVGMAESMLADVLPGAGIDDLVAAARTGHVGAVRIFEDVGLQLGRGLAAVANLINPSLLVVGGELARAEELLLEPARLALRRHALATASAGPDLVLAELGDRASVIGALLLALDRTQLIPETGLG